MESESPDFVNGLLSSTYRCLSDHEKRVHHRYYWVRCGNMSSELGVSDQDAEMPTPRDEHKIFEDIRALAQSDGAIHGIVDRLP